MINFGADEEMEKLIDIAYKKLADMMFAPFSMPKVADESVADKIGKGIRTIGNTITSIVQPISIRAAYSFKS